MQSEVFKVVFDDRPVFILICSIGCNAHSMSHIGRAATKHAYLLDLKNQKQLHLLGIF
jgi:hypothetical protein